MSLSAKDVLVFTEEYQSRFQNLALKIKAHDHLDWNALVPDSGNIDVVVPYCARYEVVDIVYDVIVLSIHFYDECHGYFVSRLESFESLLDTNVMEVLRKADTGDHTGQIYNEYTKTWNWF